MLGFGWMRGQKDLGVGNQTIFSPSMGRESLWLLSKRRLSAEPARSLEEFWGPGCRRRGEAHGKQRAGSREG